MRGVEGAGHTHSLAGLQYQAEGLYPVPYIVWLFNTDSLCRPLPLLVAAGSGSSSCRGTTIY